MDLHRAILRNNSAVVSEWMLGGAEVDVNGLTPLYLACLYLNPAIVDALLRHNADIDIVTYGRTALQWVISRPVTSPNRVSVLQLMATCAQTRLEASSADWIRLALNESN